MSLKGYYSISGRTIDLVVYWPDAEPQFVSYQMTLRTWTSDPGFDLVQCSEDGIFTNHTDGSRLYFSEEPELSAEACKLHCLELWGIEPQ